MYYVRVQRETSRRPDGNRSRCPTEKVAKASQEIHTSATYTLYLVWFVLDTTGLPLHNPASSLLLGCFGRLAIPKSSAAATGGSNMQYLPGWTVQCINQECSARGHWLRAYLSGPNAGLEFCPSCGSTLQAVPPPIGPRLRMRPRALAARPPLRPRPR